mmetsp:Transcript_90133/g.135111  ORF Transcript_90133/g.135111 Transcript_90133/m.135111 type:complete len:89 (-) Transcript_90133:654-920(-)
MEMQYRRCYVNRGLKSLLEQLILSRISSFDEAFFGLRLFSPIRYPLGESQLQAIKDQEETIRATSRGESCDTCRRPASESNDMFVVQS